MGERSRVRGAGSGRAGARARAGTSAQPPAVDDACVLSGDFVPSSVLGAGNEAERKEEHKL